MFRFASYLLPTQSQSNDIQTIQLDEARLQTPQGIREFRFLLRKLKKADAAEIVWLSNDFPQMDYKQVEDDAKVANKQSKPDSEAEDEDEEQQWQPTQGERNKLAWMLENQRVFLTQYSNIPQQQNNITYTESLIYQNGWQQYIPSIFLPEAQTFHSINTRLPYRVYPFSAQSESEQALIWYNQSRDASLPELSLALFSRYQNSKKLNWNEQGKITLDNSVMTTNSSGKVFNYFSSLTGHHTQITAQALQSAYEQPNAFFKNKIILIGQDLNQLQVLADSISSLQSNATFHTPAESLWLLPLMLSVVVIYLLWLLPLFSKQAGVFLGAFLILGIISAQPILLILKGIWWPTINILLLMLIGHVAVYVYVSGRKILNNLLQMQNQTWFQLGHYQYEKGDYETALTSLLKCDANDEVLTELYEIALRFERKRQYDKALQVYTEINIRQKNYKDIDQRLKSLTGATSAHTQISSPVQQQKTMMMPQMEMPEFGRYKIEKELGRGAMGVVYLGIDPKINRQVAIKTLDYTQFSPKELKTVKSRFFREAEAAGRLSHNDIVTVYDVGEEDDFAFIAMDYVAGVPLSDFTAENKLLPVAEVYRIMQVTAAALDYAHKQNIVHRDIKPGNIMYNPKNKQVKIADFGIARITDSVKTKTGSFMGSPSYMAPEQIIGTHVDGRADIYSLGISFYQLLTGRLPFSADSLGNLAHKIANEKHKPIRDLRASLPASATRIINKALQKDPAKRYATGADMVTALKKEIQNSI